MDRPPIIKLTDFGIAKSIEGKIYSKDMNITPHAT